jgi:hypothetical protein
VNPAPLPRERPTPGRGAVTVGCSGGRSGAAAAADGAARAPASSPDTPPARSGPTARHRHSPSAPDRGSEDLPTLSAEHVVEGASELGVVVAEQEADRHSPIVEVHRDVPCLLARPCRVRARRDSGCDDPSGAQLDEEQHIEGLEPDRLDREEVATDDPFSLGPPELRPRRSPASRGRTRPWRRSSILMVVALTRMPSLRSSP